MLPSTAQTEHALSNNDNHTQTCDVTTYRLSPISYQVVKRMQLIFTVWYSPLTLATMVGGKHTDPALSLRDLLSTGHHSLGVSFITSQKWNLRTALATQNTAENGSYLTCRNYDCTSRGQSAFPSANHDQGQLQTPQSLSVHTDSNSEI